MLFTFSFLLDKLHIMIRGWICRNSEKCRTNLADQGVLLNRDKICIYAGGAGVFRLQAHLFLSVLFVFFPSPAYLFPVPAPGQVLLPYLPVSGLPLSCLKTPYCLAAGSFSAHNALWPVSEKSVHPVFQGQQRPIWESISMMDVGNVFLCFGLNDLNIDDKTIECYKEVIRWQFNVQPVCHILPQHRCPHVISRRILVKKSVTAILRHQISRLRIRQRTEQRRMPNSVYFINNLS